MNDLQSLLSEPIAQLGATPVTLGAGLAGLGIVALALLVALVVALWRSANARAAAAAEVAERVREADQRMAGLLQAQAEMQGRMGAIAEVFGARQAELTQSLGQRLDAMTGRIGQTMAEQTRSTHENLAKL
ncbi:MAG: DNA recombination protein RmuC, partial [Aquamicrobium sp.]|nr:DNA recombination protein RmuC [Aquamicrobium sp.]